MSISKRHLARRLTLRERYENNLAYLERRKRTGPRRNLGQMFIFDHTTKAKAEGAAPWYTRFLHNIRTRFRSRPRIEQDAATGTVTISGAK